MSDRFGTCARKREHGSSGPPILVLRDVGGESIMLNNGSSSISVKRNSERSGNFSTSLVVGTYNLFLGYT